MDLANAPSGSDDVDADQLDGVNSTGFIHGEGRLLSSRTTPSMFQTVFPLEAPSFFQVLFVCGNGSSFNNVAYRSQSSEALEVFFDNGGGNPVRQPIAGGDTTTFDNQASQTGELNTIQASAPSGKLFTATITSAWRPSTTDCVVNAQGSFMEP